MDIYSQDLGAEAERVVQGLRNVHTASTRPTNFYEPSTWPGWLRDSLAVGTTGSLLSFVCGIASGAVDLGWALLLITGVVTVITAMVRWDESVGPTRKPGLTRKQKRAWAQGPLTVFKVRDIKVRVTDPLQRPFLDLVVAAINTPPPPDAESQKGVREAIRALGESITGLPLLDRDGTPDDPAAFQLQATQLSAEADAERDPVIAASLRRRADALHRQAETAERTNTLLRRNDALRQEIAGQIAALQTSLTALRVGGAQAVYELADVAANIQQVAIEAGAITQARSEMGDIVSVARREPPQAVQQVRR